jgi:5-methyltetrahydrofolate--homocysteine methyltransferase
MTDTVLMSATKEVVLGFERPFVIIGERINALPARRSGIRRTGFRFARTPEAAASRPVARRHA